MNNSSFKLVIKLSKPVCSRCSLIWIKNKDWRNALYSTKVARTIAKDRWDRGYAPCNFAAGQRAWSNCASPPKECPHKFEHGVAHALEDSRE